jgi:hypothetical protein
MWKKVPDGSKQEMSFLRGLRRVKLYADEDVEEEVVYFFREKGVNIKSARELGHCGKPDSFHAALSFKEKRFLLTKNAKHYLDDRTLPFHKVYGIITIEGDMKDTQAYLKTLFQVLALIPYGDIYEGMKIHLSPNEGVFRFIDSKGRLKTQRFKTEDKQIYEWVSKEKNDMKRF